MENNKKNIELIHCPFCGMFKNEVKEILDRYYYHLDRYYYHREFKIVKDRTYTVVCLICDASSGKALTYESAIEKWNRRDEIINDQIP